MKSVLLLVLLSVCIAGAYAQSADTSRADNPPKKKGISISIGTKDILNKSKFDSLKKAPKPPGFSFKLTFARLDLGFVKLIDNGNFSLSPANSFLDYNAWKSNNVGFDVLEFGYRIDSHLKIYLSGGFDWNHLRLEDDITILQNKPVLSYSTDAVNYHKNRFTSSYLRMPLSFEFRSKSDRFGKKLFLVFGPDAGFLINGRVKQKSKDKGKQKFNDDYHFSQFRYGAFARMGYGAGGLFIKYYSSEMFENSPAQKGLRTMSFGVTHAF